MNSTDKSVQKELDRLVQLAYDAVREAEAFANANNKQFDFDISYGMGGTYYSGNHVHNDSWLQEFGDEQDGVWVSSSQEC